MNEGEKMLVTTSPHVHNGPSTSQIMWTVSLCLLPAGIWGVSVFGLRALTVILVSIAAAVAAELVLSLLLRKGGITVGDGSAFLTGLLVGYNMPAAVPLYIPVIASVFAIAVVKWSFGGLGANWMNPALAGRAFVFFSWTGGMTAWTAPRTWGIDTVSSASPLGGVKTGLLEFTGKARDSIDFLSQTGYPLSRMGESIARWLSDTLGWTVRPEALDLFLGNVPGSIGEVSALLLLLGAVVLLARRIITWHIPAAYIVVFSLLTWIFGGLRFGNGFFSGDVVFHLFAGGLILGAFYMATDMVTSPLTPKGMLVFGAGIGFFTFLIRFFGSFPEGVSLAIIIMNIFVPLINRFTGPKRFGTTAVKRVGVKGKGGVQA